MTFLSSIIERKKLEVKTLPAFNPPRTERSLVTALRSKNPSLLAEIKPRSPSKGELIDRADIPRIVSVYSECAQGISVLCDHDDFGGGYDLLQEVRALTDLPLLAKEFIIDPVQISTARQHGADAVLLIAAILTSDEIQNLAQCSLDLEMCVLLELHNEDDVKKIPDLSQDHLILGINNRDLRTLAIDLSVTQRLAPSLRQKFPRYLLLSESGVASRSDIDRLKSFVDGFLMGTALLTSPDPRTAILQMFP